MKTAEESTDGPVVKTLIEKWDELRGNIRLASETAAKRFEAAGDGYGANFSLGKASCANSIDISFREELKAIQSRAETAERKLEQAKKTLRTFANKDPYPEGTPLHHLQMDFDVAKELAAQTLAELEK